MHRLLPWLRRLVVVAAEKELLQLAAGKISHVADEHVPLGGATTIGSVFAAVGWADTIKLATVCRPLHAAVCAMIGSHESPVRVRATQLPDLAASHVARLVRVLQVECAPATAARVLGAAGTAAGAGDAVASAGAAGVGFTEDSVRALRSLPLLRSLSLREFSGGAEMLILLTLRPGQPELLQAIEIKGCPTLEAQYLTALWTLPALHTLALSDCTMQDDTLWHSSSQALQERLLHPLQKLKHLTALQLDYFKPGNHFRPDTLDALGGLTKLKTLHVNALWAGGEGILRQSFPRAVLASPNLAATLQTLSLSYADLAPWPSLRGSAAAITAAKAVRAKTLELFAPLRAMEHLRMLELSFVKPLGAILAQLPHLPVLQAVLIGDEDFRRMEDLDADPESGDNHLMPLLRAPALQFIALYGFVGILERKQRMDALATLATKAAVRGVPDPNTGELPRRRIVRLLKDAGERREHALKLFPEFAFPIAQ